MWPVKPKELPTPDIAYKREIGDKVPNFFVIGRNTHLKLLTALMPNFDFNTPSQFLLVVMSNF